MKPRTEADISARSALNVVAYGDSATYALLEVTNEDLYTPTGPYALIGLLDILSEGNERLVVVICGDALRSLGTGSS